MNKNVSSILLLSELQFRLFASLEHELTQAAPYSTKFELDFDYDR
jgi:hypothetical protein